MRFLKVIFFFLILLQSVYSQSGGKSPIQYYQEGYEVFLMEDYFGSIELFRIASEINPVYGDAVMGLAKSYFFLGEYDEALIYINRALKLQPGDLELIALKGRVLIGIGGYKEAAELFNSILVKEPNNIEAQLGLAELSILEGDIVTAQQQYTGMIQISPENKRALLSLSLVHQDKGDFLQAENYIKKAVTFHQDDLDVHFYAARHYLITNQIEKARQHIDIMLFINENHIESKRLLGGYYLRRNDFEQAAIQFEECINLGKEDNIIWYILGYCYQKMGKNEKAGAAYYNALTFRSEDEVARLSIEYLIHYTGVDLGVIAREVIDFHLRRGAKYENENLYKQALIEYRRALWLSPEDKNIKVAYAEMFRKMGYLAKAIDQFAFLQSHNETDTAIDDIIESLTSYLEDNVSGRWDIDQFNYEDPEVYGLSVSLFVSKKAVDNEHYNSEILLGNYFKDIIVAEKKIYVEFSKNIRAVESFSEAFRIARSDRSDYFLILKFDESQNTFIINSDMYLTKTGGAIHSYSIIRNGNDMIIKGIRKGIDNLYNLIPHKGTLIKRDGKEGVINLGLIDGIVGDTKLIIVKKNAGELIVNSPRVKFHEEDLLGTFTVTNVDDKISEGTIVSGSFADTINIGDEVYLFLEEEIENIQYKPPGFSLKDLLLKLK